MQNAKEFLHFSLRIFIYLNKRHKDRLKFVSFITCFIPSFARISPSSHLFLSPSFHYLSTRWNYSTNRKKEKRNLEISRRRQKHLDRPQLLLSPSKQNWKKNSNYLWKKKSIYLKSCLVWIVITNWSRISFDKIIARNDRGILRKRREDGQKLDRLCGFIQVHVPICRRSRKI